MVKIIGILNMVEKPGDPIALRKLKADGGIDRHGPIYEQSNCLEKRKERAHPYIMPPAGRSAAYGKWGRVAKRRYLSPTATHREK